MPRMALPCFRYGFALLVLRVKLVKSDTPTSLNHIASTILIEFTFFVIYTLWL